MGHRKVLCFGQGNPLELWQKTEKDLHTASPSDSIPSTSRDHALLSLSCVQGQCVQEFRFFHHQGERLGRGKEGQGGEKRRRGKRGMRRLPKDVSVFFKTEATRTRAADVGIRVRRLGVYSQLLPCLCLRSFEQTRLASCFFYLLT